MEKDIIPLDKVKQPKLKMNGKLKVLMSYGSINFLFGTRNMKLSIVSTRNKISKHSTLH